MILLTIYPVFIHMHTSLHNVNVKLDSTPDKAGHHPTHKNVSNWVEGFYEGKGALLEIT
jgi:hypothetical protein